MENNPDSSIFNFNIDEESKSNLSSIAQWANINAIVGFAGIGVSILGFVIGMVKINSNGAGSSSFAPGFFGVFVGLILSLALNITLIYAAINIKKGLSLSNQPYFVTGLTKLATYFKIFGILMIIALVIIVLALLAMLMFGSFGRVF